MKAFTERKEAKKMCKTLIFGAQFPASWLCPPRAAHSERRAHCRGSRRRCRHCCFQVIVVANFEQGFQAEAGRLRGRSRSLGYVMFAFLVAA